MRIRLSMQQARLKPLHVRALLSVFVALTVSAAATADSTGSAAEQAIDEWRERFGDSGYRLERDRENRLIYFTALDERSHRVMREMLETQAAYLSRTLFDVTPTYDVAIIIPKPEHSRQYFERDNVGGMYSHSRRRLIARDIGFTLRHEFVHLLHFRHMEQLQQPHRLWVQEGIAALFEDYELEPSGAIRFIANERHNVIHGRVRGGADMPWSSLFELPGDRFMARATTLYPQARSIFEFVADQGKLADWYRAYVEHFEVDESGVKAFEQAFGKPLRTIERDWRRWVQQQPTVQSHLRRGDPSLGVETDPLASNDGVLVRRLLPDSPARRAGILPGDVIVAIDGRITPTIEELRQRVLERGVGQTARVEVRRRGVYQTYNVTLAALEPGR
jgi:hypothetical protein